MDTTIEEGSEPVEAEEPQELARAREAVLELLASTLDAALPLVTDAARGGKLTEIAVACERIGFLGNAARRLALVSGRDRTGAAAGDTRPPQIRPRQARL